MLQQSAAYKSFKLTFNGTLLVISFVVFSVLTACNPQQDMITPESSRAGLASIDIIASNQTSNIVIDSSTSLKAAASFPVGAAPGSWLEKKTAKGYQVFVDNFNAKTVHAYMNRQVSPGNFNFSEMDYWVKWAETHAIRLHGHCLVYQGAAPDWILNFKGPNNEFEQVVKTHIQTMVGRYKGKIKSWDVVNELINDKDGTMFMRVFRKRYNSDASYIEFLKRCFQWAHEADPNALLFYNDYNFEIAPAKVEGVIRLVNEFKRTGTPIHGIGTQMHMKVNTPDAGIRSSLQRLASTGLLIHISELDIQINLDENPNLIFTNQLLDAQAAKFRTVAQAYKELVPRQQQYGITVWDLGDADSWIVNSKKEHDAPCLFNTSYNKKPAYYGFLQGLR
ncbi:hypothetical protein GCM10028806_36990 [Spirosoma terrae]|uniref:Beta-xylanase n=1 Tax=Spirosoma terrae TaxID=1968276 RepID=A0A6L9LI79_9BACT|nr:endo-1,4-beta-xylanase [Spirosoma terrae]NDU98921.1 endo-1,4-beta-xylanase [Spirosoma terrae]